MDTPAYQLQLRQKLTVMQNRYEIVRLAGDSEEVLAHATQKRFSLKEKVTFTSAQGGTAFTLGGRNILEVKGTYDIVDSSGHLLATIQKELGASLLRSTYRVEGPGWQLVGEERGALKAVLRRAVGLLAEIPWPFPIQFDFKDPAGRTVLSIDRQVMKLRDRYDIRVYEPQLDWRVAAALGVTVDAFMDR